MEAPLLNQFHNGLAGYLARHQLQRQADRVDGAVVLFFDKRYRVFCRPAPHGDLVLESRIIDLPTDPNQADDMVREALFASWVRMLDSSEIPALSTDDLSIVIQQRIPSDASVDETESALESYVNALSEWRRIFKII
jgi:hypothetical protein